MNRKSISFVSAIALTGALLAPGCGGQGSQGEMALLSPGIGMGEGVVATAGHPVDIPFDATSFVAQVTNPYFPLPPGRVWSYVQNGKDGVETNVVEVTSDTKEIQGVQTTVVHDVVKIADGSISEDTFDWYAQDQDGNVWYFGEDTRELDHGTLVGTTGSWEAGKNGASAGIIMLAHPEKGDTYQQENSPGVVADMAKVMSLDETATVPFGTYAHCLKTQDWTPLEPGIREYKFYAPNVGVVLELTPKKGRERVELTDYKP